jgi:hypothetical protein
MFWTGALYFAIGMYCIFVENVVPVWLAQVVWITALCLPFAIPPFGRWLNMDITWDKKMFNLFGSKNKELENVVQFPGRAPGASSAPPAPPRPADPPKEEEPAKIFYRLGLTDNNRVAFSMGYSEITMNRHGCQQMIDQLTFFQSQLYDEDGDGGGGPDGGEPLPVPEEKTEVKGKKAA